MGLYYIANTGSASSTGGTTTVRGYTHLQTTAATQWLVQHNLNGRVLAQVIDALGNVVLSDIQYNNLNTLTVSSALPTTGEVRVVPYMVTSVSNFNV